jgi:hypothetical protein
MSASSFQAGQRSGLIAPLPIEDYDELTVAQVKRELRALTRPQLRRIRDYERSRANRHSLLEAIERHLEH